MGNHNHQLGREHPMPDCWVYFIDSLKFPLLGRRPPLRDGVSRNPPRGPICSLTRCHMFSDINLVSLRRFLSRFIEQVRWNNFYTKCLSEFKPTDPPLFSLPFHWQQHTNSYHIAQRVLKNQHLSRTDLYIIVSGQCIVCRLTKNTAIFDELFWTQVEKLGIISRVVPVPRHWDNQNYKKKTQILFDTQ